MRMKTAGIVLVVAALVSSCATTRNVRRANEAEMSDNWDAAVYYYLEALADNPGDARLRMELQRARLKAADRHFRKGLKFRDVNDLERAKSEFELAVQLDPTHQYAEVELSKVRKDLAILSQEGGPAKLEAMKRAASEMKVKPPILNAASNEPISLSFPNPTNVKEIYKAIGQAFGINILFDPKLKDSKISIELKDVTARQALENVMQAANHFYKVLDDKTVIVVEDTPQNRRDYEDLVVKTFFLSNADVKEVNNMLRALIDARRIAVNESLNSIVIRDTADKVAIAERLINANDKSRAEVLVDVELIQVDSSKLRDIGTSLSSYSYTTSLDTSQVPGNSDGVIPLTNIGDITRSMWGVVVPSLTVSLVKSAGEAETLAQPQLRITEGEKGNLVIGDRVPIPTTTFNTTQTIGGNVVPITAFQYQDVGIKIDIEPRVHHNNEITLKLQVEVSELGENVEVATGQSQPKIGTRTINSVIRLKDGETSLLAGLYKYNKRESRSGMPWLSDIPIIGGLFRSTSTDFKKTDLVLTLTPHIIRNPDITEEDLAPLWVGTENRITIFGNSPRVRSPYQEDPFASSGVGLQSPGNEPPYDPQAAEHQRQQRQEQQEQPDEQQPQTPTELVPPTLPGGARPVRRRPTGGGGNDTASLDAGSGTADSGLAVAAASADADGLAAAAASADADGLASISFYPARVPVVVGNEATVTVFVDPGIGGAVSPIHLAYDPARLQVVAVDGAPVPGGGGGTVSVVHTPALGWMTLSWTGPVSTSGRLATLTVRPLATGEIPVIFAGPVGAMTSDNGTIVALPSTAASGGS